MNRIAPHCVCVDCNHCTRCNRTGVGPDYARLEDMRSGSQFIDVFGVEYTLNRVNSVGVAFLTRADGAEVMKAACAAGRAI